MLPAPGVICCWAATQLNRATPWWDHSDQARTEGAKPHHPANKKAPLFKGAFGIPYYPAVAGLLTINRLQVRSVPRGWQ